MGPRGAEAPAGRNSSGVRAMALPKDASRYSIPGEEIERTPELPHIPRPQSFAGHKWAKHDPTNWVLYEHIFSWTGDDFTVYDPEGKPALKCVGSWATRVETVHVYDAETNEEICVIARSLLSEVPTFIITVQDEVYYTLRKDRFGLRQTIRVFEGNAAFHPVTGLTDARLVMTLLGEMFSKRNTHIYWHDERIVPEALGQKAEEGDKVAYSHEKRLHWSGLFGKEQYQIWIEGYTDVALVLCAMIVKDEMEDAEAKEIERKRLEAAAEKKAAERAAAQASPRHLK